MNYEIQYTSGRQVLNATFSPPQLTVGAAPRARLVRAWGADGWYRIRDRYREPTMYEVNGIVWSDGYDIDVVEDLSDLRTAMATATRLYAVEGGTDVAYLEVDGGLEPIEEPENSQVVNVTLLFYPEEDEWRDATTDEAVPF